MALDTKISNFKAALEYGGARPSLFDVTVSKPSNVSGNFDDMQTTCSVSAIPPLTVTPIERQYFGRTVKIPGDIVFGDLSTTIINTENFSVRKPLEDWMNRINNTGTNYGYSDNSSGFGEVTLTQYDKTGKTLLSWTFHDCWPQTVAEVALSYDTASDIETFDVTWAYNYYTQLKPGGASSAVPSNFARQT
tara:strand:+ start:55 stop:627 length:573 start_codon:yes stop_codon:yes gene_type:complete